MRKKTIWEDQTFVSGLFISSFFFVNTKEEKDGLICMTDFSEISYVKDVGVYVGFQVCCAFRDHFK